MAEIRKKVEDITEGELVDLASCPYLKDSEIAKYEYGRVSFVERESQACTVIGYEGIDHVGYPAGTELIVANPELAAEGA